MHGTIGHVYSPISGDQSDGWEPYIPGFWRWREVVRQLGHRPTLYVMRKRDGRKWHYRACTPAESSSIEQRDCR